MACLFSQCCRHFAGQVVHNRAGSCNPVQMQSVHSCHCKTSTFCFATPEPFEWSQVNQTSLSTSNVCSVHPVQAGQPAPAGEESAGWGSCCQPTATVKTTPAAFSQILARSIFTNIGIPHNYCYCQLIEYKKLVNIETHQTLQGDRP